jgi:uncharacterized oligopeptide transporter (OPT) family protein
MPDFTVITELWNEYYPIVVAGIVALGAFLGAIYLIYTQVSTIVSPILDKIQSFRDKDDESALANATLDDINLNVLKTDLLAKIANPTISPELTLLYQTQLDRLSGITSVVSDTIVKVEDKADDYL